MLLQLCVLATSHVTHSCGFSQFKNLIKPEMVDLNRTSRRNSLATESWDKIRITLDFSFLNGSLKDKNMCTQEGQQIDSEFTKKKTCNKEDILTPQQIENIIGTMNNVKKFFENFLYVTPVEFEIPLSQRDFDYGKKKVVSNTDFYITVLSRAQTQDSNLLAAANALLVEKHYNRPIQGLVFVNPKYIPSTIEDEHSTSQQYFNVYVHELMHALGFNGEWDVFHPMEDPTPFKNPTCELTKYKRKFKFLVTPYAHIYAINHYGVEEFVGDDKKCPSGIEIEDMGSSGTAGMHLKGRVFFSETMGGVSYGKGFHRLTDATIAVLLDTGNYRINWTMARPLVFGNPESIDGKPIENFALGPPELTFPDNYLIQDVADNSLFNFKNLGDLLSYIAVENITCGKTIPEVACSYLDTFINPRKYRFIGYDETLDFQFYKYPKVSCPDGKATIHGNLANCYDYKCNNYTDFTIQIENNTITCNNENAGKQFNVTVNNTQKLVWCPSPERFCRTMKLHEMYFTKNPFIKNVRHLDPSDQGAGPDIGPLIIHVDKPFPWLSIVIICVVLAIIIASIVGCVCCCVKKCKKSDDDYKDFNSQDPSDIKI